MHVDSTGELPLHAGISCVKSFYMFGHNVLPIRKLAWLIHPGRYSIGKNPAVPKGWGLTAVYQLTADDFRLGGRARRVCVMLQSADERQETAQRKASKMLLIGRLQCSL